MQASTSTPLHTATGWAGVLANMEAAVELALQETAHRDTTLSAQIAPDAIISDLETRRNELLRQLEESLQGLEDRASRAQHDALEMDRILEAGEQEHRGWLTQLEIMRTKLADWATRSV